jgi:hypothetical protein
MAAIDGDYQLDAVGGKPLPAYSFSFEGGDYYIVSLRVHLSADGRLAPYYAADERDSVAFSDGKPIISTSSFGGGLSLIGADSLRLANFPGVTGAGATTIGAAFTLPSAGGEMHFRRIRE